MYEEHSFYVFYKMIGTSKTVNILWGRTFCTSIKNKYFSTFIKRSTVHNSSFFIHKIFIEILYSRIYEWKKNCSLIIENTQYSTYYGEWLRSGTRYWNTNTSYLMNKGFTTNKRSSIGNFDSVETQALLGWQDSH